MDLRDEHMQDEPVNNPHDPEEYDSTGDDDVEDVDIPLDDLDIVTFNKHTDAVLSADFSKDSSLVITSGVDQKAYIWCPQTLEVVLECTGYTKPVHRVGFNFDDEYAAAGDREGTIRIWNLKHKTQIMSVKVEKMFWFVWHQSENILVAGCGYGETNVWRIPEGNRKTLTFYSADVYSGQILPDGDRLVTGYCGGFYCCWDLHTGNRLWFNQLPSAFDCRFMACPTDYPIIVFGASGEAVETNDWTNVESFSINKETLTAIATNSTSELLATISLNGTVRFWDLKNNSLKRTIELYVPLLALVWTSTDLLFIGSARGDIYICDTNLCELIEILTEYFKTIKGLFLSKDGSTILVTSYHDKEVRLFSITN